MKPNGQQPPSETWSWLRTVMEAGASMNDQAWHSYLCRKLNDLSQVEHVRLVGETNTFIQRFICLYSTMAISLGAKYPKETKEIIS